jgi:HlyD family secretion protein
MKNKRIASVLFLAAIAAGTWYYTKTPVVLPPPQILKASVSRGPLMETVQAMGIVEPRRRVNVGSQVSGVVKELYVDFNSVVTEGQLLAEIEPTLYEIQVQVQEANVARQKADIGTQEMQLEDQKRQFARIQELFAKDLQNEVQVDAARLAMTNREAQILSAKKQLVQAEAALGAAKLNLAYTKIYSPIDGVVINRRVDRGQAVQASMSTPNFFMLSAPFETLRITAGVDEADIGRVRPGMPVKFKVGTFGQELFSGTVDAVRLNASHNNFVVTYPVWIRVPNDDLRLRPGMTATVYIEVSNAGEVARIPNEALKFRPTRALYAALGKPAPDLEVVRAVDLSASESTASARPRPAADEEADTIDELFAPLPKADSKGTVWRWDENTKEFTSVAVRVGVSDGSMTELLSGDVNVGDELVTGVILPMPRPGPNNASSNPLMGPQRGARGGGSQPQPQPQSQPQSGGRGGGSR